MTPDRITFLRTTPNSRGGARYATKQWAWNLTLNEWRQISYDAGTWFLAEQREVSSIDDLAAAINDVRGDPRVTAVRGDLTEAGHKALRSGGVMRRLKKVARDGSQPTLAEVPRHWMMVDVDGWRLPEWADLAGDPEAIIEAAIYDLLPEPFHDVRCFWQLSSSAGFKVGVLKVHIFFWLEEAASNEALKEYLQVHAPKVDRAPFNAAQPHYIADPIVSGGHDPLPRRTGWIKGMEDVVALGDLDRAFLQRTIRERREKVQSGAGLSGAAARSVEGLLALIGDGEGREGFHAPLRNAAFRYAIRTPIRQRDDDAFKAMARAAIERAEYDPRTRSAQEIDRYTSDAYLDDILDSAFARVGLDRSDVPQGQQPFHAAPDQHVADARELVGRQIDDALQAAAEWHDLPDEPGDRPPSRHIGLAVDVGTGKSRTGRGRIARFVRSQKAKGKPYRVLWLVPTIKLGGEAERHFTDLEGVKVAIHRGREQPDPEQPEHKMCMDLEAVKAAEEVLADVDETVCGDGETGCPFFSICGYQRQKKTVAAADVVIGAHELAFHTPGGAKKDMALTVFDEAWWQDGLSIGRTITAGTLAAELRRHPIMRHVKGEQQVADEMATNDQHGVYLRADAALEASPEGYVKRQALLDAGLTALACTSARAEVWKRKRVGLMRPGMSLAARKEAAKEMAINPRIPRLAAMWQSFADLLSGEGEATGVAEIRFKEVEGGQMKVLHLNTRKDVKPLIQENPALLLDATMPEALVRPYLPRLEVAAPVRVQTPDMTVRQVVGGFGKTSLVPHVGPRSEENSPQNLARLRRVAELRDFVEGVSGGAEGWEGGAGTLVVTYKAIEEHFASLPHTEVAHFNDVAGRDQWGKVRNLFVIGRPLPHPEAIREIATALTGQPVVIENSQKETRAIRLADGTGRPIEVRTFDNETAEAVRAAITDAEVIQAIGRARGVNRTADDPVNVWLMADVVTPLVVESVHDWRDLCPGQVDRMACRGLLLTSPADAAAVFPDLFPSQDAARMALKRAGEPSIRTSPYRYLIIKECSVALVEVIYRKEGAGQTRKTAWVREDRLPGLLEWLEERLGRLAHYSAPVPPHPDEEEDFAPAAEPVGEGPPAERPSDAEGSPTHYARASEGVSETRVPENNWAEGASAAVMRPTEEDPPEAWEPPPADPSEWEWEITAHD
ncbi:Hypothetical protein HVPorG_04972 (plasmid) [Roseomonas mucosa]|uniref:hypothetical protein n=1 Tax=Roseomonas mucosa TaxID=207340 RepID=UPI0022056600|nr:hypothetical protein [Roseomonas mucosa]QDJ12331.1 Hypothetical protein HVPorG_04972 [Roseomonas mucosa]